MQFALTDACAEYTRTIVAFRTSLLHELISGAPDTLEQHKLLFEGQ